MKTNTHQTLAANTQNKKGHNKPIWKTKDPLVKKIITYLCLHHQLNAAFLISKQTHSTESRYHVSPVKNSQSRKFTYTLFIIANKIPHTMQATNPGQLMEELYAHTQKQAHVFCIPFTETEVIHQLNTGSNFISSILKNAPCIYRIASAWEKYKTMGGVYCPSIYKEIRDHWETRYQRANYLHNLTVYNEANQDPAAYFEVLQKVIQQTCLGIIYVFWEYKPSNTSLTYLLHLCSHFSDFPYKIFHTNTYKSHCILHLLCQAEHSMKFKIQTTISLKQIDKAWKKCDTFLKEAQSLALQQLQVLENKCYATAGRK